MSQSEPHDEFLELCAVSTSGELTEEEQKKLQEHLAVCLSCREAFRQYQLVVDQAIPAIAAGEDPDNVERDHAWSPKRAEKAFFDRLAQEEKRRANQVEDSQNSSRVGARIPAVSSDSAWRNVWTLYVAGILLFLALSFFAYRIGIRRGSDSAKIAPSLPNVPGATQDPALQATLEEQLSDAGHDREVARSEIVQRDKVIATLRRQLDQQSAEISQMKAAQGRLEDDRRAGDASRQDLMQQKTDLAQKLESAQAN